MQPPRSDLQPPKDDTFTAEQLKEFDGTKPGSPIYVAIKGVVFDVTRKADSYGPGAGYHVFAGKDASKALGMSSVNPADAESDYSSLDEKQLAVLEQWFQFFSDRYNIAGKVVN